MSKKIKQGDKFPKLSAGEWNRHVDMADRFYRNHDRGQPGELQPTIPRPTVIVKVRNDSGGNWAGGSVVQLGTWILTGEDLGNDSLWFAADDPDDAGAVHAVLRYPIEDGKIGEAQLLGVVVARVNVNGRRPHLLPDRGDRHGTGIVAHWTASVDLCAGDWFAVVWRDYGRRH